MTEYVSILRRTMAIVLILVLSCSALAVDQIQTLRLTLPKQIYAVPGMQLSIYFDNVVLTETPEQYRFHVECPVGSLEERRWTVTPEPDDVGIHDLLVSVSDVSGQLLERASTSLHVTSAQAGAKRNVQLMIVGDSLTHATHYPNALATFLNQSDNLTWEMLGTHEPENADNGVHHEGYGGWTWQQFANQFEPNPDGTYRKRSSPFVFLDDAAQPQLDVARYFEETSSGRRPDVVFFLLGINDCFHVDPDDPSAVDARIDEVFVHADRLLKAFQEAAPETDLAICITPPPNAREAAFEANYEGRYRRWGWKRIQHRLVERLIEKFETPEDQTAATNRRIDLVPTQLNLDPIHGYPENNGVHPNVSGYEQIGTSLYCWLMWRLSLEAIDGNSVDAVE